METNTGSFFKTIDNSLVRNPFENYLEYKKRVENIKAVDVGKGDLIVDSYDKQSGICLVNIDWYGWESIQFINCEYFYVLLPNKGKKYIESFNNKYNIAAKFDVKGEIVHIDVDSLKLCIDDIELNIYPISVTKQIFETYEEFKEKIENIRTMPLGEINIEKEKYDINTNAFELDVTFETLKEVKIPNINGAYTFIEKEIVQDFYDKNKKCVLYGNFNYLKGEISIDLDSLHILYNGNKIKVYSIILDTIYFDTEEQYSTQVQQLSKLCSGKASLMVEKYDKLSETLPIRIKWNDWIKEYVTSIREQYIEADRKLARTLLEAGKEYSVYAHLINDKGELNIDEIVIKNYIGDIEVKFKDVFKSINSLVVEDNAIDCDILNNEEDVKENNHIDEKFDFVGGIALVKLNGKYTYINESGEVLGLLNKRLMRFINNKGKYGYMDNIDRAIVIRPDYDYIGTFSNGLAKVNIDDKWGYINENGEIEISPEYEFARDFHDGFAAVKTKSILGTRWGYINKKGNIVITPKYEEAGEFSNGFAYVKIKSLFKGTREGYISEKGEFHDYVKDIV